MRSTKKRNRGLSTESFRDRVRRRAKERKMGNRDIIVPEGTEFYRAKKTRESARIDIIPYRVTIDDSPYASKGDMWYEKTYNIHYNVGGGNSRCICPTTINKKCPICEYAMNLRRQPKTPEIEEEIKSLRPKQRQIFNVIDLAEPEKGIQIHENAFFNFGKELEKEMNDAEGENPKIADFANYKNGYTLKIRWDEENAGGHTYLKAGRIDFIDRKKQYSESILDKAVDLDNALNILSYEEIERMFNGAEDEEETKPEDHLFDADREARTEINAKKKSSKYDEDEEEDEIDDDEIDDDEDEENSDREVKYAKPKKRKTLECPIDETFGKDWDEYDQCEDCEIRKECKEEYKTKYRRK